MRFHLVVLLVLLALAACPEPGPSHGGPGQYRVEADVAFRLLSFRHGKSNCILRIPGASAVDVDSEVFVELRLVERAATPVRLVSRPTASVAEGYGILPGRVYGKLPTELWVRPAFCPIRVSVPALTRMDEARRRNEAPIVGLWLTRNTSGTMEYAGYELLRWEARKPIVLK